MHAPAPTAPAGLTRQQAKTLTLSALGVMGPRDPSRPKPAPNMPLLGLGLLADLGGAGALVYGALGLSA